MGTEVKMSTEVFRIQKKHLKIDKKRSGFIKPTWKRIKYESATQIMWKLPNCGPQNMLQQKRNLAEGSVIILYYKHTERLSEINHIKY